MSKRWAKKKEKDFRYREFNAEYLICEDYQYGAFPVSNKFALVDPSETGVRLPWLKIKILLFQQKCPTMVSILSRLFQF